MQQNNPLLEVSNLSVFYGGICALDNVSMSVNPSEIIAVIGANGAGKTTLLKTIAGVKEFSKGNILFNQKSLPRETHNIVQTGITLVPEGRRIFAPLTVKENLMLGAYSRSDKNEIRETMDRVFTLFPVLNQRINQRGGTLSGGEQQMLAIGRALMSQPRLLLLDEPSLGLAPIIIDLLFKTIVQLNQEMGLTILLVEQNAAIALENSHRAYVFATGKVTMEGSAKALLNDARVKESYLGVTS